MCRRVPVGAGGHFYPPFEKFCFTISIINGGVPVGTFIRLLKCFYVYFNIINGGSKVHIIITIIIKSI